MNELLGAGLTLVLAAGTTLVIAAIAIVVIGRTRAREPAFAAFCVAVGWALGGHARWPTEGLPAIAALAGVVGALLLVWHHQVRPERAAHGALDPSRDI